MVQTFCPSEALVMTWFKRFISIQICSQAVLANANRLEDGPGS